MRVEPGSPAKSPPAVVAGVAQRLSGEVEEIVEVFREILNRAELQSRRLLGQLAWLQTWKHQRADDKAAMVSARANDEAERRTEAAHGNKAGTVAIAVAGGGGEAPAA